ncbi:hypothetical protein V494_01994 [Pseudogymnoascus sp. VKM F-4513 (FW-928)]|nr:hypothetical protein V494_01994 [Pseudogymnoascus sp. VKM F-4513 (FW-928)]
MGEVGTDIMSSIVFVVSALDAIAASKEAHKKPQLGEATKKALADIKALEPQLPDPEVLFIPLQLATQSSNIALTTTALDCIGKLISYSYFSLPSTTPTENDADKAPLIERAIDTICNCFQGESTPVEVQLQIVKSLLAAVLNDKIVVHGAGLLKAVRQVYNVFLLSKNSANQQVAQGTLTQMVGTVFERVKTRIHMKEARANLSKLGKDTANGSSVTVDASESEINEDADTEKAEADAEPETAPSGEEGPKLTLKDLEHRKDFDDSHMGDGPTMVTQLKQARKVSRATSNQTSVEDGSDESNDDEIEDEVYIRDAYLVFRSFCNLSTKVLPADQLFDLKSQAMRSKLISLHLIHTLLNNHVMVFTSPLCTITNSKNNEQTSFLQAVKYYLCLSITRNGASSADRAYEVCCEIFWLMLKYMRAPFKKEIEVFLNEIYFALIERRSAPLSQKIYFMGILQRFCADPRALVETYLNYDCDRAALDNMFQRLIEDLSKASSASVTISPILQQQYEERANKGPIDWQSKGAMPPPLSTMYMNNYSDNESEVPKEYIVKRQALDCLVETLRSLVNWSQQGIADVTAPPPDSQDLRASTDDYRASIDPSGESASKSGEGNTPSSASTPIPEDDPDQLEKVKQRKTEQANAIKSFNFKPKRGIKLLLSGGFIPSESPEDIARFLLTDDRLDKAQVGEFLGEGDPKNIEIMHAFVDAMDFTKRRFVDALRQFLQSFRLPGEAQKIDRFMLKFANRYVTGNPNAFANADTAYVLAYSVILLNTDLHSSKVAKRMTKEDFIKNNRGINDNANLPDEYLNGIYDEIAGNEIVLRSEQEAAAAMGIAPPQTGGGIASGLGQALATVGRDLQREAYLQQAEEISMRSEQLFKTLFRNQRRNAANSGAPKFIPATSFKHVGPMFEVTWMSFFSGLSGQMQTAHNLEIIKLCMEGMKLAVRIACLFDLETPREAFISALKNSTNLNNLPEMMAKNVEALKVLLEIAQTEGNVLKGSWKDILMCVSQLDRLQLISGGVDERAIPDVSKARIVPTRPNPDEPRKSTASQRPRQRPRSTTQTGYSVEIALESRSDEVIKGVDRIFTNTANLSGEAIVHFVRALTEVSWEEIKISGQNESPRTYSLQKLVEISYYNMTRVRFEWTNIWVILGEHFNKVGTHNNTAVVFFALDSLRQLSMRFMEMEELPGFKFQKDFLKPFEHVMSYSNVVAVKDMALRCLIQMIQARGENIRSGWRTMFAVFTVAAREPYESIVNLAFDNVNQVYKTRFGVVISQAAFPDLVVCLTEFSKNMRFQKKGLQAMETLKSIIPKMLKTPECPLSLRSTANSDGSIPTKDGPKNEPSRASQEEAFWFPVLFAFHDVLMTGEDLEIRSNSLNYLFDSLIKYGGDFPPDFWDIVWRQLLYPIFMVLKSKSELSNVLKHEELSVWLSTTMIQALRSMITLFTHYFEALEYMLDRFLDLLALCICQENDTIARIGSNCLQQLILQNVTKFKPEHWSKVVGCFVNLFKKTTAYELFSAATNPSTPSLSASGFENGQVDSDGGDNPEVSSLKINGANGANGSAGSDSGSMLDDEGAGPSANNSASGLEDYKPQSDVQQQPIPVTAARRRFFNQIITQCVLQLLMIETVNELFSNDAVYAQIPSPELLRLMGLLKSSFLFAKKFNNDKDLRMRLWREGFMKQPPNLLKQESGSASTYVSILLRMYHDESDERKRSRNDTEAALVPLCADIIRSYTMLDEESQQRNIIAWRPVVVDVIEGYTNFPEDGFTKQITVFYPLAVDLLNKDVGVDIRLALQGLLRRVGETKLGIPPSSRTTSPDGMQREPNPSRTRRASSRRD